MKTKSEERRQHIMGVADGIFRSMGFEATSMAQIAAEVGGSKATLYNYFATKEDLFLEIMLASAQKMGCESFSTLERDLPIAKKLLQFGQHYLQFILSPDMLAIRRMAIAQAQRSNIGVQVYERGLKVGWGKVAAQLEIAMQAGTLHSAEPWLAAMHLKGLLEAGLSEPGMLGVTIDTSTKTLQRAADTAVSVFMRAYGIS